MRLLAIDPSLTSTGYAYTLGVGAITGTIEPKKLVGARRLCDIRDEIDGMMEEIEPALVVMEKLIGGPNRETTIHQAELIGVLKVLFHEKGKRILLVPPSTLKLFATGKGNADKDEMRVAAGKERGKFFQSHDEADAFHLLQMGIGALDRRSLPRERRHYKHAALRKCEVIDSDGARVSVETVFNGR